ncbi:MAG TPA: efflux RND transporter periplasmic adaptor subunit [Myxococcaceae bacterium]|nr:efflux RND transporter periplasmic adaptor subunit [Myxococcaceae bacterium]
MTEMHESSRVTSSSAAAGEVQPHAPARPRALTIGTVILVLVAVIGVLALAFSRRAAEANERQQRAVAQENGPVVRLAPVELSSAERTLAIPGEVRGWNQATLYAKVAGYVREVKVDKGTRIKKGDLLAQLESPETDQQVLGARADLQLKLVQAERARKLRPQGFIAQQDLDNAESALSVSRATLQQLLATQSYEQVRAPFDGVVTARYVDPGALVAAGTASNQAVQPLFDVADMRTVRVQVYVGQDDASDLRPGVPVSISLPDDPGHPIEAKVSRTAQGLDTRTRTMLVEVDVANEPARLYPGSYVNVRLRFPGRRTPLIPGDALAWRGDVVYVARLDPDNRVKFVRIQPGEDNGRQIQVLSGLQGGEQVVLNPSAELSDGDRVQPLAPRAAAPAAGR